MPRINSVQTKRENKIKEDIKKAKQLQAEAEDIQEQINKQLDQAKSDSAELIKSAFIKLQDESSKKLEELDKNLSTKIDATYEKIEKNKSESMSQIYEQINDITKLMISKISNVKVNEGEIKIAVEKQTTIKINGVDKDIVGKVASEIKKLKTVEPYKAKGIKEKGQYVLRKEGKKK